MEARATLLLVALVALLLAAAAEVGAVCLGLLLAYARVHESPCCCRKMKAGSITLAGCSGNSSQLAVHAHVTKTKTIGAGLHRRARAPRVVVDPRPPAAAPLAHFLPPSQPLLLLPLPVACCGCCKGRWRSSPLGRLLRGCAGRSSLLPCLQHCHSSHFHTSTPS